MKACTSANLYRTERPIFTCGIRAVQQRSLAAQPFATPSMCSNSESVSSRFPSRAGECSSDMSPPNAKNPPRLSPGGWFLHSASFINEAACKHHARQVELYSIPGACPRLTGMRPDTRIWRGGACAHRSSVYGKNQRYQSAETRASVTELQSVSSFLPWLMLGTSS